MFRHLIRSGFRALFRNKVETLIKLGGLAVGLGTCILIALFVRDEASFDGWWAGAEDIYRVEMSLYLPGREPLEYAVSPGPARAALQESFPNEISNVARIYYTGELVGAGDRRFQETIAYVDPEFFNLFPVDMISGSREAAVADNSSLIISEAMATKYFGDTNPLGRTLTYGNQDDYRVVGVFRDMPLNSHFTLDFAGFFDVTRYEEQPWVADDWDSPNLYTYLSLDDGTSAENLLPRFPGMIDNYNTEQFGDSDVTGSQVIKLDLISLLDIHLFSERNYDIKTPGSIWVVYAFTGVSILILLIACINYINLTTARATNRASEIALRKVLGAERKNIIIQFVAESTVLMALSLIVAVGLAELALPFLNEFLGKGIAFSPLGDPLFAVGLPAVAFIVGSLTGLYPALYLASFRPSRVLHSGRSEGGVSGRFRSVLVVLQYAVSIGLIISTVVVFGQTRFARNLDLGYQKEGRILVQGLSSDVADPSARAFKQEVEKLPGVRNVALADNILPRRSNNRWSFRPPSTVSDETLLIDVMTVDYGYFETYGIAPIAGRLFSEDFTADRLDIPEETDEGHFSAGVVINESAARKFGLDGAENALGQLIRSDGGADAKITTEYEVVGVIPDIHIRSVRFPQPPIVFINQGTTWNNLVIAARSDAIDALLPEIDRLWNDLIPDQPVSHSLVAENIDAQYLADDKFGQVLAAFASLALLISSLGLFGLSAFIAERRTREIGIRKVMGAGAGDIVRMLVWQLSKPVVIANLLAWPVAWLVMRDWLNGFVYRMDMSLVLFATAGLAALAIAWVTVAAHALRVARANPIHALRYE